MTPKHIAGFIVVIVIVVAAGGVWYANAPRIECWREANRLSRHYSALLGEAAPDSASPAQAKDAYFDQCREKQGVR